MVDKCVRSILYQQLGDSPCKISPGNERTAGLPAANEPRFFGFTRHVGAMNTAPDWYTMCLADWSSKCPGDWSAKHPGDWSAKHPDDWSTKCLGRWSTKHPDDWSTKWWIVHNMSQWLVHKVAIQVLHRLSIWRVHNMLWWLAHVSRWLVHKVFIWLLHKLSIYCPLIVQIAIYHSGWSIKSARFRQEVVHMVSIILVHKVSIWLDQWTIHPTDDEVSMRTAHKAHQRVSEPGTSCVLVPLRHCCTMSELVVRRNEN